MSRWRRIRLCALGLVALALVTFGVAQWQLQPEPLRLTARFDNTVGVYEGSDVRVLGVKVGSVTSVAPSGEHVEVSLAVDPSVAVAEDTRVVVVAPTMVADRYVQLTVTDNEDGRLADGAVIPSERTATPVEIDRLYESLDQVARMLGPEGANRDGALSELIGVATRNLDGNGARTRKLVTDLGAAARTLAESDDDAFAAIEHLDRLAQVMEANDGHVRGVAERVARVTGVLAQDRRTLQAALQELGTAMGDVQSFVHDNRADITRSLDELAAATKVLADERDALSRLLGVLPRAVAGLLGAYDGDRGVLVGRANPHDATRGPSPDLKGVEKHAPPKLPYPMPGGAQ